MSCPTPSHPILVEHDDPSAINTALNYLENKRIIGLPTETVYGLAGDATSTYAAKQIYAAKLRPPNNPLIIHVDGIAMAKLYGQFDARARQLAQTFWPGSLTLVLPKITPTTLSPIVTASLTTIAIRCPNMHFARRLIRQFGRPLAAPSANPSGKISPTCADHVYQAFLRKDVPLIIDGGTCRVGLESTILTCLPGQPLKILRPGTITRDEIALAIRRNPDTILTYHHTDVHKCIIAPGTSVAHYAPNAETILINDQRNFVVRPQDAILTFAGQSLKNDHLALLKLDLSPCGDLTEATMNLFAMLHRLDFENPKRIVILPVPRKGLGIAIMDRLQRASTIRESNS